MTIIRASLWAVLAAGCVALPTLRAGECQRCGCEAACNKVCRAVCKSKKVTVTCWDCVCEPFCVPGPGKACDQCGCSDDRAACTHVHVRKKLMKKEITKEVMVTEWVVEELCAACRDKCQPIPGHEASCVGLQK